MSDQRSGGPRDRVPEARGWRRHDISTRSWGEPPEHLTGDMARDVEVDLGWGRVIFGQTFASHDRLEHVLRSEARGRRDVCLYLRDPHVLVSRAPHELFVDPSYTYRIWMHRYRPRPDLIRGVTVRTLREPGDADAVNRVYSACGMVPAPSTTLWDNQRTRRFSYLMAADATTAKVVGTVTGIDHARVFGDPEGGSSLWCLAVHPQCAIPGVGEALVRTLVEKYQARGRAYLDLSVMHDNAPAIALYEKLGFERVPVFCVKRKNPINEPLFSAPEPADYSGLNPYARIVADEARRRGIAVEVLDSEAGFLRLAHGGRAVVTRESLSELTSAVAMSRCDDKRITRRILHQAGLRVPQGRSASFDEADHVFLDEIGEVVVKPARGEQGQGITVGVTGHDRLNRAIDLARQHCAEVLIEECCAGEDLRVIVIGHEVVAAAVRCPPTVTGTGRHSIADLISRQSRRRAAATGGESSIPLDDTTVDTVRAAGHELDSVLREGETLAVRRTANLHTGGTIHDVTEELHPDLAAAAVKASRELDVPVTGLDLLVPRVDGPDYVIIEANERPGLANHEPQPTAARFVDLLFPATRALPWGWTSDDTPAERQHRVGGEDVREVGLPFDG
ncbi:N-acetylglutaminylglutamine synthetase [soil metagenome]